MNILNKISSCNIIVTDIDGVLSDGSLLVQSDGTSLRVMNIKDGYALQLAAKKDYEIIVISGAENENVKARLQKLGIKHIYTQVKDKQNLLESLATQNNWSLSKAIYIGDDNPDIAPMKICGVKACPSDASIDVQMVADYIAPFEGGKGCVRDIIEKIMRVNGDWE